MSSTRRHYARRTALTSMALIFAATAEAAYIDMSPVADAIKVTKARNLIIEATSATKPTLSVQPLSYRPLSFLQTTAPQATPQAPASRALPQPLNSPPLPMADWVTDGTTPIGENWDATSGWLQKALVGSHWDKERIKIYGWLDVGYNASTSNHNNFPLSYDFMPNRPVLDQGVLTVERMPDTVQTDHNDWGFRSANLYGTDYRFTAGDGWLYDQLQKRNALYGFDPVELFFNYYIPKVFEGTVITVGRYISPPDIEAQLGPQNYLYSHSLMFTVDPYTYTGVNALTRLSKYWSILTGITAGNDTTPWEKSGQLEGELLLGWHSHDNNDSVWFGSDSFGNGHFRAGHDNEQITSFTWGHKFNDKWHNQMEGYYMFEYDAAMGGSEIDGASEPYASGGGAGPILPGQSHAWGAVDYLVYQIDKKSYATFRTDFLGDPSGWRTGFPNDYYSETLGYARWLNATTEIRPEVRYEWADKNAAYDNGTKKTQWTLAGDLIWHF